MPNEMTIAAAIIEANRAKNPTRSAVDYDYRTRAMNKLIEAAQYRIPMRPDNDGYYVPFMCRTCINIVNENFAYCPRCGQAIDWASID